MFKNTIFRRMTALVLTLALAAAAALPGLAVYPMPIQTAKETEAVYLFNADTGGAAPCGCPALVVSFQVDQSYIKPTSPKPRKEHPHV